MAFLSNEQKAFLVSQKITLSSIFDASGLSKTEYRMLMKEHGKLIAYGVSPCKSSGHTLRTRSGHCIQCDTARIEFQSRQVKTATVYIAASFSKKIIKIGCTNDTRRRELQLNTSGYGNVNDWEIICTVISPKAGKLEFSIHNDLKEFSTGAFYIKDGKNNECYELFKCTYEEAYQAMLDNAAELKLNEKNRERLLIIYN